MHLCPTFFGSGENGLLSPCFYVYFSKVHQNLLNFAGGAPSSTAHFSSKVEQPLPKVEKPLPKSYKGAQSPTEYALKWNNLYFQNMGLNYRNFPECVGYRNNYSIIACSCSTLRPQAIAKVCSLIIFATLRGRYLGSQILQLKCHCQMLCRVIIVLGYQSWGQCCFAANSFYCFRLPIQSNNPRGGDLNSILGS